MMPLVPEVDVRRQASWWRAAAAALAIAVGALSFSTRRAPDARIDTPRRQAPVLAHGCRPNAQLAELAASATDPWGHHLRVACHVEVGALYLSCDGPDGLPGTADDLRASPDAPAR